MSRPVARHHRLAVLCAALLPLLGACGGISQYAEAWRVAYRPERDSETRLCILAISADGRTVAAYHVEARGNEYESVVRVYECPSMKPRASLPAWRGVPDMQSAGAFSPDGKRLLLTNRADEIQVFDAPTGERLAAFESHFKDQPTPPSGHYPYRLFARFSPDGRLVASWYDGGPRGGVRVWEADSGRQVCFLKGPWTGEDAVTWSPDSARLATRSSRKLHVWNAATGSSVPTCDDVFPLAAAWGRDGPRLLAPGEDGYRVLDADGTTLTTLEGETGELDSPRFSPDATRIVALDPANGHVVWWDAATGRRLGCVDHEPRDGSFAPRFSADSRRLVLLDEHGSLSVYETDTGALLSRITLAEGDVRSRLILSADATCLAYYEGSWAGDDVLWVRRDR